LHSFYKVRRRDSVCTVCAKVCHKDHEISYAKYGSFFCDCGPNRLSTNCTLKTKQWT
uniref:UBR-type domain-containing protein n=1 Tax=Periophthalmus magnuspinnatus TaxID=409849 RepID=A0A3B3ZNW6_9GOBI